MTNFANLQTLEVEYTSAQTDAAIVTATATQRITITQIMAILDESVTVNGVGFRVGLGTPGTPTGVGVVLTHPGLEPGKFIERGTGAGNIAEGDFNEDLRITSEAPTGGALRILVSYIMVEAT